MHSKFVQPFLALIKSAKLWYKNREIPFDCNTLATRRGEKVPAMLINLCKSINMLEQAWKEMEIPFETREIFKLGKTGPS